MSEPGATPTDEGEHREGCSLAATPQPERLSAERLADIGRYICWYDVPRPPVGTGDYVDVVRRLAGMLADVTSENLALRSTIAQLEADDAKTRKACTDADVSDHEGGNGDTYYRKPTWYMVTELAAWKCDLDRWHDAATEDAERWRSLAFRFRDRLRAKRAQVAADADGKVPVWIARDDAKVLRARAASDAGPVERLSEAIAHALALFPDPEHTQPSSRTVDMAGRPVGELATRTLITDEQDAAT